MHFSRILVSFFLSLSLSSPLPHFLHHRTCFLPLTSSEVPAHSVLSWLLWLLTPGSVLTSEDVELKLLTREHMWPLSFWVPVTDTV